MFQASQKYSAFPPLNVPARSWPNNALRRPPRWLATDLRDGNQSLPEPMSVDAKLYYFQSLVRLQYKEIEISYPSASQTEFDFTRRLATTPNIIPDDVWIQVMAPCREELIRRTIESVRGMKRVIVHLHVSTSECFRRVVFKKTEEQMIDLAVRCTHLLRELTKNSEDPDLQKTEWTYEFTPENFQDTSLEYAVRICEAVKEAWEPTEQNRIIFNLPSTVEVAMPNIFADQIETFCNSITDRRKTCVSVHTHNDRGCAIAAAEMAQLAGADRVEGCLFGNGERTGNVDLVTLALNLYTQGIDPGVKFVDITQVVALVEDLTKVPVHPRAPYAGKYVFCTFTGTHQDAIRKGYRRRSLECKPGEISKWEMPYLPMDPEDLGRKHEAIIRVNSQSGKSGIAWLVQKEFDIDLPLDLELDFTRVVQEFATASGKEVTQSMIKEQFEKNYMLISANKLEILSCSITDNTHKSSPQCTCGNCGVMAGRVASSYDTNEKTMDPVTKNGNDVCVSARKRKLNECCYDVDENVVSKKNGTNKVSAISLQATVAVDRSRHYFRGIGPDITRAIANAIEDLGLEFEVLDHSSQLRGDRPEDPGQTVSFIRLRSGDTSTSWGVGIDEDRTRASMKAALKAGWSLKLES